jgi:glycosyltransferase involved in cell wall biosynthesis
VNAVGAPVSLLHVHSGNLFGGVERMLESMTKPTASMTSRFALCFEGRLSASLTGMNAEVHQLGPVQARNPLQIWHARRALERLIAGTASIAVVHSAWAQAIFGPVIARAGLPLVRWFHSPDPGPTWMERWARRTVPDMAVYNSLYTRRAAHTPESARAIVAYPPMTAPSRPSRSREAVRAGFGTAADRVVMVMASRLEALKGHSALIDAMGALADLPVECWIAGGAQRSAEHQYLKALEQAADRTGVRGRVRFVGEQQDVESLFAAADIHCQPNVGPESFGMAFVEAMAAGLPVVTTRIGAAPEIVDETCGVLVEPNRPAELVATLRQLVIDETRRRELGTGAQRRAAAFFDLDRSLDTLAEAFRPLTTSAGALSR